MIRMGWFDKSINDDEWYARIRSEGYAGGIQTLGERFDNGLKIGPDGDIMEKMMSMQLVMTSFPQLLSQIKRIPSPESAGASSTRNDLISGVEHYVKAARFGTEWLNRLMEEKYDRKGQSLQKSYEEWGDKASRKLSIAMQSINRNS